MIANIGITAISCVNSTEKDDRPPVVRISLFSVSVCSTIAVDDSAKISPTASAGCQASPSA